MPIDLIISVLSGLAVAGVYALLSRQANKVPPPDVQGRTTLRMSKLYYYMGGPVLIIAVVFAVGSPLSENFDTIMLLFTICTVALMGGLGAACSLLYKNHRVFFDAFGFEVRSLKGQMTTAIWKEVGDVKFNSFSGYLVLILHNGTNLKVHQHLIGVGGFVAMLAKQTGRDINSLRFPVNAQ